MSFSDAGHLVEDCRRNDDVTPTEIAEQVEVSPKAVRDFLLSQYGTLPDDVTRWRLTARQVFEAFAHFTRSAAE